MTYLTTIKGNSNNLKQISQIRFALVNDFSNVAELYMIFKQSLKDVKVFYIDVN